jgi:hypothetical protein
MRRFRPIEAIVKALQESDTLNISESNQITRKTPLVTLSNDFEENKKLLVERALPNTLYVKGFRIDSDYRDSQRKVQEFFKPYGIAEVRLRRLGDAQKLFKGSVYAEFPDVDSAEQFRTKKHHFEGRDLEVLFKKDYIKREVDLVMENYDVTDLGEDKKENAITEGRKILEQEYMDPQAPLIGDAKKGGDQPQESDAATKDIQDRVAKAKAKYVEKQDKVREQRRAEREAEQGSRNKDKRRGNNNDNQKRPREDDQQDEEHESKRPREEAANGEGKTESGAADVKTDETAKTEATEAAEPKAEGTADQSADVNAAAAE